MLSFLTCRDISIFAEGEDGGKDDRYAFICYLIIAPSDSAIPMSLRGHTNDSTCKSRPL